MLHVSRNGESGICFLGRLYAFYSFGVAAAAAAAASSPMPNDVLFSVKNKKYSSNRKGFSYISKFSLIFVVNLKVFHVEKILSLILNF